MPRRSDAPGALRAAGRRLRTPRGAAVAAGGLLAVAAGATALGLAVSEHAGPQGDGTAITPTGWKVAPVGKQVQVGERPYGVAMSPDGKTLLVSNNGVNKQSLMAVDPASGAVTQTIDYPAPEAVFIGVAFSPDGKMAYASGGNTDEVHTYAVKDGKLSEGDPLALETESQTGETSHPFPAGLTVSPDGKRVYVADTLANALSIVDTASGDETRVPLSDRECSRNAFGSDPSGGKNCLFPYTVALSRDGAKAYVSNWGQDTVSVVDTASAKPLRTITVGTHPSALVPSPTRDELYVANTEGDSIAVVNTRKDTVARTIKLDPYKGAPVGTQPNALAVAPDGKRLYVADAGNNDVTVIRLGKASDSRLGHIPTGWYPSGVALDPSGDHVFVANGKGLGAGPNPNGPIPDEPDKFDPEGYIGSMIKGTLSIVETPKTSAKLAELTSKVRANNDTAGGASVRGAAASAQNVVPTELGQSSPIKHVIYIVNENRTYDQVLGDLGKGNGDPSLTLFPKAVTPNHHALASTFVTLDNIYAAGEVSDDGWEWSTGANANTLDVKTQPTNYGGRGFFYVGEGGTLGASPGKDPEHAYIWDGLDKAGIGYRNYGFWATDKAPVEVYNEPTLDKYTDHSYIGFNMAVSDQSRYQEWLKEFKAYEASGDLPTVEFLKFPRDHTAGTTAGAETPKAMVADSDYALGQLVDTVSHSKFWKDTAIFVIEDDAQDGPDHVDAHRVLAQVISPYTRTGKVDSTFYSSVSMLRTMELILGLSPMTQFDAAATPMFASFTDKADTAPFTAIKPQQPLDEKNPETAPMARQSATWNFKKEDQAPWQELNTAIWKSVRGADSDMPEPVNGLGLKEEEDEGHDG